MRKILFAVVCLLLCGTARAQNFVPIVSGVATVDASQGTNAQTSSFLVILNANVSSLEIIKPKTGQQITIILQQDATGGRTVSCAADLLNCVTVTSTANAVTSQAFAYNTNTNTWSGLSGTTGGSTSGVSSVAQTVPSWLTVAGSPITTSGTLAITPTAAQTSHQVIGTCGAGTTFAPCALVAGDIPTLPASQVTGAGMQGVFYITTACGGQTNCLQWVDDDSTDNCGTATTNFMALINGYNGPGAVQVNIGGSGPGKAFKLQTCQLIFNVTATRTGIINANATFDAGTNSSANLIQFGDGTNAAQYRWNGGWFIGGASLTVAGMEIKNGAGSVIVSDVNWVNFGAGNATLGSCTNYAIQFDNFIAEGMVQRNFWGVSDATTGRCFSQNVGTTTGQSTVLYLDNTIGGKSGVSCASQGIVDGGFYGIIEHNNVGNIGVPIRIFGGGHTVANNQLDTEGCTANGVNALIQFGQTSGSGTVDAVAITGNTGQFGGGHATNFIQKAGDATSSQLTNAVITGNRQSVTTSTSALLIGGSGASTTCGTGSGQFGYCYTFANENLSPPFPCGATSSGWTVGNRLAACAAATSGANIGSTLIFTAPAAPGTGAPIKITCQALVTTQATTTSTLPQCVIAYTDGFTSAAVTLIVTPVAAASAVGCSSTPAFSTNPAVGYSCQGSVGPLFVKAGTNVNFSTINYASSGATAAVDQVFVTAYID